MSHTAGSTSAGNASLVAPRLVRICLGVSTGSNSLLMKGFRLFASIKTGNSVPVYFLPLQDLFSAFMMPRVEITRSPFSST